ncbi:MAG: hypothetical protein WKF84_16155 [Pyrinomonadaceae bacterium]
MLDYAEPVIKLIDEFKRLPGIGHKSAQRLAFHIMLHILKQMWIDLLRRWKRSSAASSSARFATI